MTRNKIGDYGISMLVILAERSPSLTSDLLESNDTLGNNNHCENILRQSTPNLFSLIHFASKGQINLLRTSILLNK